MTMDREAHGADHWDGAQPCEWQADGPGNVLEDAASRGDVAPDDRAMMFWPQTSAQGTLARKAVVVLGMHRSGTSALTRLLALHGAALPARLEAANPTNSTGHWESRAIREFNEELLAASGSHWADWRALDEDGAGLAGRGDWLARGRALLVREFGHAPLCVMKDPRHCRLAGFWLAVLAAQGVDVCVVLPVRAPAEVAASLRQRDGFGTDYGLLLWLGHVLAAERASRGCARMFTTYEALLVDGRGLAARLNAGLALGLGQAAPGAVEAFIDPSLRRQRVCGGDGADWVGQVHAIMQRWAETGEDAQDHARLDAIAAALAEAGGCFAALVADGRAQLPELADLRGRLTAMRGAMVAEARRSAEESASLHARVYDEQTRVAKASAAAAEMELQLHEARDWVFRLSAERAAAAREAQRLTRAAAASAREAAAASGAVRRLEAALAAEVAGRAESQKAAFEAGRAALAGELAQARGHLRDAEDAQRAQAAALAERFEEIAQITAMLQARDGEVARLSALVDTAQAASEAAQVACAALTAQLGDALASCAEADVTRQAAEAARARDEDERGQLAAQLATTQAALHEAQAQAQAQGAALAERFDEIAHLARLLGAREAEARLASARVQWLRGVAGDLLRALGLWRWLPGAGWFARRRLLAGLRARGEFDARFYLRTHSDVAGAGMDPLRHYILFGQDEGRAPCAEMGRDARATARGGVLAAALATTVAATSTEGGLV